MDTSPLGHKPVLLTESIDALKVEKDRLYVDCTFGGGGHTREILKKNGRVLSFDADPDADARASVVEQDFPESFTFVRNNFEHLEHVFVEKKFGSCHGVLFDLGVSSFHFDHGERGFSIKNDGPLDMRFDTTQGITAGQLLDILSEKQLEQMFVDFGEISHARTLAKAVVKQRAGHTYWVNQTTTFFAQFVSNYIQSRNPKIHPATQVFQALRIAVNDEIGALERALPQAFSLLDKGGRVVVISFHSLEDRPVRMFFEAKVRMKEAVFIVERGIAGQEEVYKNPRSRSAILRVIEKL